MIATATDRMAAIKQWERTIDSTIEKSELRQQLNKLAAHAQEDSKEPVRIALTSGFYYLGVEAKLVTSKTLSTDYVYQPLQVVLEAVRKMRTEKTELLRKNDVAIAKRNALAEDDPGRSNVKVLDQKTVIKEATNIANAVRLERLVEGLFEPLYVGGVQCIIIRGFQLVSKKDGKVPIPGKEDDFRATWSAGWWLDQLVKLFQEADMVEDDFEKPDSLANALVERAHEVHDHCQNEHLIGTNQVAAAS